MPTAKPIGQMLGPGVCELFVPVAGFHASARLLPSVDSSEPQWRVSTTWQLPQGSLRAWGKGRLDGLVQERAADRPRGRVRARARRARGLCARSRRDRSPMRRSRRAALRPPRRPRGGRRAPADPARRRPCQEREAVDEVLTIAEVEGRTSARPGASARRRPAGPTRRAISPSSSSVPACHQGSRPRRPARPPA